MRSLLAEAKLHRITPISHIEIVNRGALGRWGDGEMGRWGDGDTGRWSAFA
ncbi:hypothetical protein [Moorena sp. SIO4G3]|uniref:hypothetical protein n=1 Tax=Moorena sp. SIO4G3 TaxID=2607821 RepID=UPI0014292606|nr:hypothetical protein [Moorena sp. SIO4G3]NEO75308.1 hypothetical protein [Moorena sp. SIO4G3]